MRIRPSGRALVLLVAVLVLLGVGIGGYLAFGLSLSNAIYLTVGALTTEGFAVTTLTPAEEFFTAFLAVMGVSVFLTVVGVVGAALVDGRIGLTGRRRMQRRIEALRDHHIICAYGRVGHAVAREFEAAGEPFVVIDNKPEAQEQMARDGVLHLVGSASSEEILEAAGVRRARGLVCAVDSDAENVYITLVARSLNAGLGIVARAGEPASTDRLFRAGADRVVSPYQTSGRRMALLTLRPGLVDLLEVSQPGSSAPYRLEELSIDADSGLAGRSLSDICAEAAMPLLLRKADGTLIPNPGRAVTAQSGDVLVVFRS